jgi:predicted RecB family nuclease
VGIHTIDELAALPAGAASALVLGSMPGAEARVRARAWLRGLPLIRRTARVAVPRADIELDVDMESYLDDGAYLWGTYLTGADVGAPAGYRAFATWEFLPHADEGRAFVEFWRYLRSLQSAAAGRGLTMAVYCYSRAAEERWLRSTPRRYPDVPGMPSVAEIAEFCASPAWVDVYAEIRSLFVVPGSMRLKALAPVAGFAWRDPEPGGENSMAWYRQAVGADTGLPDLRAADRVLRYNEDDVLATLALRRWITDHAHEVPTVADLDAGPALP